MSHHAEIQEEELDIECISESEVSEATEQEDTDGDATTSRAADGFVVVSRDLSDREMDATRL